MAATIYFSKEAIVNGLNHIGIESELPKFIDQEGNVMESFKFNGLECVAAVTVDGVFIAESYPGKESPSV